MVTEYDVYLNLAILFAMFLSLQPKKGAIAFIAICSGIMTLVDVYADNIMVYYYTNFFIEITAATCFLILARRLKSKHDRFFFRAMAGFFLLSYLVTYLFIYHPPVLAFDNYKFYSRCVAIGHVLFMLGFSDGIRGLIRTLYYWRSSHRSGVSTV